jgi:DNA-binding transcriptional ArsR family regulator
MTTSPTNEPFKKLDTIIHSRNRLEIMYYLNSTEYVDYKFLLNQTKLTWGNLSSHISILEQAKYVEVYKKFMGKKPYTLIRLTKEGRTAFDLYKKQMRKILS